MHDLSINSPILVYREGNIGQSREWKGSYNLLSIQAKSVIIELLHGPTKFRSISIKPYLIGSLSIDNQQPEHPVLNNLPQIEETLSAGILQIEVSPVDILSIKESASLASLASVKQGRGRPRKYPE